MYIFATLMKKCIAFLLLLCHMNTSMFLPQVQEEDMYSATGQELDDINSIVELVNVELGYDTTADDEDSDNGQNFHIVKSTDYCSQQQSVLLERTDYKELNNKIFSEYRISSAQSVFTDVLTPPPNFS